MTPRGIALLGAILALVAVALGAFGAHALRSRVAPDLLATFETGARYHMYHALALFACAWAYDRWGTPHSVWAAGLFLAGITLFSGSLYLLTVTGQRWWGAVTPFGGVALLAGWASLAWGIFHAK